MEFIQFHPDRHGVAAVGEGHPGDRGRARRGRRLAQQPGQALHVRRHPRQLQEPDRRQPRRGLALHPGRQERPPPARAADPRPRRPLYQPRSEGRPGSPHGGVYLDIAWIKEKLSNSVEHIKKKLPSMYHQFKKLADLDITTTPMEVGPTTHYVMGGVRVDADTQMSKVPAVRRRRVRQRHQRRQPAGRQLVEPISSFGKRAGNTRRNTPRRRGPQRRSGQRAGRGGRALVAGPVRPADRRQRPFQIQYELQELMQENVGIVRREDEMKRALEAEGAAETGGEGRRPGQPGVQPRLVDGAGSSPCDRQRGDRQGGHRAQGEPRRSLPRRLPGQGSAGRHLEQVVWRARRVHAAAPRARQAVATELKQIIEEQAK